MRMSASRSARSGTCQKRVQRDRFSSARTVGSVIEEPAFACGGPVLVEVRENLAVVFTGAFRVVFGRPALGRAAHLFPVVGLVIGRLEIRLEQPQLDWHQGPLVNCSPGAWLRELVLHAVQPDGFEGRTGAVGGVAMGEKVTVAETFVIVVLVITDLGLVIEDLLLVPAPVMGQVFRVTVRANDALLAVGISQARAGDTLLLADVG